MMIRDKEFQKVCEQMFNLTAQKIEFHRNDPLISEEEREFSVSFWTERNQFWRDKLEKIEAARNKS